MKSLYYNPTELPKAVVILKQDGSYETYNDEAVVKHSEKASLEALFQRGHDKNITTILAYLNKTSEAYTRKEDGSFNYIDGWVSLSNYQNGGCWVNDPEVIDDIMKKKA